MDRKKVQNPNRSIDCKRWSAHSRGGTSVRSWLESVRNHATTRRNASCPIARQAVQRQRILLWVGQRSRATINPKWEILPAKGYQSIPKAVRSLLQDITRIIGTRGISGIWWQLQQAHLQIQYEGEVTEQPQGNLGRNLGKMTRKTKKILCQICPSG